MVRKLKYHEQKLLKKFDFLQWKKEQGSHELHVIRRYHVQKREDYVKYNKLCGEIKRLLLKISKLHERDPYKQEVSQAILDKLFAMGLITSTNTINIQDKVSVAAFCRRRLGVVMVRLHMAQTVKEAVRFIEQGHVRVGPETITDPAFLVTRNMEDYITWVDNSAIRRKVLKYNDKLDDFDLLL